MLGEKKKTNNFCNREVDQALEQVTRRGCGVDAIGDICNASGHMPKHLVLVILF